MEVIELTKEQKLSLIDEILSDWEKRKWEAYICTDISFQAWKRGFTSNDIYFEMAATDVAVKLIPEVLDFQPEDAEHYEYPYSHGGWFRFPGRFGEVRTRVLRELRERIARKGESAKARKGEIVPTVPRTKECESQFVIRNS